MTTQPPYLSLIAPAVYGAMRAANYPCPSGDGYPTHALNIYRHLSLVKTLRSHPAAVTHLASALTLALDLVEGTDPGGFYRALELEEGTNPGVFNRTMQACAHDATALNALHGEGGTDNLHALLARCTEAWHLIPHGQDGSAGLTAHLTDLIAGLCDSLRYHGVNPDDALCALDNELLLPGRPE